MTEQRLFLGGLCLAAVLGVGAIWLLPPLPVTASADCDVTAGPCSVNLPGGPLTLNVSPEGAPPDQPLLFTVQAPAGVNVGELRLSGVSMPMGEVVVPLTGQGGRLEGTARLPVCSLAEMAWSAELVVDGVLVRFPVVSRKGGTVVDGSLVPAVDPTYPLFTLQTASGPVDLADWRGDAVVVYFGYRSCPDICPTTLQTVASAFARLPEPLGERVHAVMVTLDPERDDLAALAEYTAFFDERMVGGQLPDLLDVAPAWGVSWRKVTLPDSALGYAVDHGTEAYLIGPDGELARRLPHGLSDEAVANALREALAEAPMTAEGAAQEAAASEK